MGSLLNLLPEVILWGSVWYFYGVVLLYIIFSLWAEIEDAYLGVLVSTGLFVFILSKYTNIPMENLLSWKVFLLYLFIGLIFMFVRVYFYGRELGKEVHYDPNKDGLQKEYSSFKVRSKALRWWFMWPHSFINWLFSDIIKDVTNWMYSKVEFISVKIFDIGFNGGYKENPHKKDK